MTGPDLDVDQPPDGFEYVWVPSHTLDSRSGWEVLPAPSIYYGCRWGSGPRHAACGRPSVARLNRSTTKAPRWWHYCEQHLYGQRITDGVLMCRILRKIEGIP